MNKDVVATAIETNTTMIIDGIDEIYRDGRQDNAEQNTPDYAILRLISNILSIARDNGIHGIRSILEVGCGGGHMTKWLRVMTRDIVAFDASEEAIAVAKRSCDYPEVFRVGDGIRPDAVADRKYSLIVMSEFHPFKRPILPNHSQGDYENFYDELLERYIGMLDDQGLIVVIHGVNEGPHLEPRKLRTSIPAVEYSLRKFAVEDLVRIRPIADLLNRFLVAVTRNTKTCFYICAKK